MKKKILLILMTIIFLSLFVYSLIHIVLWFNENKHTEKIIEELTHSDTIIINKDDNTKQINFDELKKKNKDTIAWLKVNNTNIDYPVVQAKDNNYYLKHSFDKKYTDAGWVFMDYRNNINELNKNIIIYGHARKDKSMFGTLKNTLKKDWYNNKDNHIITLTTNENEYKYQVFSTYHITTEEYYIKTDFNSDDDFNKFVNTLKKRSTHNYNVEVNELDQILTLSSCFNEKEKVVLHAKLLN